MAAGAGGHGDQPIRAFFHRFLGKIVVDHVMQHDPAIGVTASFTSVLAPSEVMMIGT